MLIKLLLLFICVPAVELYLLFRIHSLIGFTSTLALVLLTAFAGSYLMRIQGLEVLRRLSLELNAGRLPGNELLDGVLILIGGVLLLTPGFLTDLLGFLFLVPWTRLRFRRFFLLYLQRIIARGTVRIHFF